MLARDGVPTMPKRQQCIDWRGSIWAWTGAIGGEGFKSEFFILRFSDGAIGRQKTDFGAQLSAFQLPGCDYRASYLAL